MPRIEIEHLSVTYLGKKKQEYPALKDVSCIFPSGQISAIMGGSGSGKTSLFRALTSQLAYDGVIRSDGIDISTLTPKERRLAYVQQEFALYPHLTVFDNLAFPLKLNREDYPSITSKVKEMADKLDLSFLLSRKPRQLSTGQIQRVCLGRALIKDPDLLLLDEPLSNVDGPQREELLNVIEKTLKEARVTAIYITHRLEEALRVASNVYFLEEGRLVDIQPSSSLKNSVAAFSLWGNKE